MGAECGNVCGCNEGEFSMPTGEVNLSEARGGNSEMKHKSAEQRSRVNAMNSQTDQYSNEKRHDAVSKFLVTNYLFF